MENQRNNADLTVRSSTLPLPSQGNRTVLVLAFDGQYLPGAMGNRNASFMIKTIRNELENWKPYGLILDFRQLEYEYGDMMDGVLQVAENIFLGASCPTVVVTSKLNRDGLIGLVVSVMGDTVSRWLFNTIDDALAAIDKRHRR